MEPKRSLPPPEIASLKLILTVSNAYYAKILPLYRKSLEHLRLRRGRVKNLNGLRVKIYPFRRKAATNAPPRVPLSSTFSVPQPSM
jgi:hypothetical protein